MRVLHVTHSYYPRVGGVEHHVRYIATQLAHMGVEPRVLTPRWSRDQPSNEIVDGVEVTREEMPGMMRNVPISIQEPFRLVRWFRAIIDADPDLVHVHGPFSPIFGLPGRWVSWSPVRLMQILGLLDAPVVVTFHGLWAHYLADRYDRDRKHVKMASVLIGVDRGICNDLANLYRVPWSRVKFIPNGVETGLFTPGSPDAKLLHEFGASETDLLILVPRRLDPKNGIEYAIRAFGHVVRRVPKARLVLLGFGMETSDSGYTRQVISLIRNLGLNSRIARHPGLPHGEMPRAYRTAQLTVIPSLWEATSLAALESLSCGTPVVASRVGGLPDVVDDSCGILVPPADEHALAKAIIGLLTDNPARARLSRGALAHSSDYDWAKIAAETKSAYKAAIEM